MVDKDFYLDEYGGTEYPDIEKNLKRAGHIIDCFIIHGVKDFQQKWYDLAVCAEAEYIGSLGGVQALAELNNGAVNSFTIGSFSVSSGASGGSSGTSENYSAVPCPAAISFLDRGGLLGRYVSAH